jgi:cobalt/nickel transport system permease protein
MFTIQTSLAGLHHIDTIASGDTPVHRIDARAKIIVTIVFVVTVMSFDSGRIGALVPFFLFPLIMITAGNIPFRDIFIRLSIALPFVVMVGIFNPFIERTPVCIGGIYVAAGWVSFLSIIMRCSLTVAAALTVLYTTGMYRLCRGLMLMGVPGVMVLQLLFLNRYLFVLANEAGRMLRARDLRCAVERKPGIQEFGKLAGTLFVRTLDRAERIHTAMISRAFTGEIRLAAKSGFGMSDALFAAGWISLFVLMRLYDVSAIVGGIAERVLT